MLYVVIILFVVIFSWMIIRAYSKHKENLHKEHVETITRTQPLIKDAFSNLSSFYNYSHYLTESERIALNEKYSELFKQVSAILSFKELEESPHKENILRFHKAMTDSQIHKKVNNEHFIENQLKTYSRYFDTVLSYPLDQQQREAVLSLEDNVLVISSAGSGKTMTTIGKVRYLIDVQKVAPERILLITFTRKAAESLSERLCEKNLKCRTFHKLALDIISEASGEKPTITDNDFSVQVYHKLFQENESFRQAVADYIIRARYKMKDQFEYATMQDYMLDRKKHGIQAFFKDMDGHPVFCKSDEESQICDFLGSRAIKFRYEEKYEVNTVDAEYRQYCPDFSIYFDSPEGKTKRIYLEHFAINENNHCPAFFSPDDEYKYKEGIVWKRKLHKQNGTTLLETTSGEFHKGNVFKNLANQLKELGVVFKTSPTNNLSRELVQQEESILNMLSAFNFLLKSRDASIETIRHQAFLTKDWFAVNELVTPFIEEYRKMEEEKNAIDFTDAIIHATYLCNNGHRPDYDYILVDEFQDISLDRYHFLQSLRKEKPLTKLFCVGDDWQSIYRFAGSDMALFKHFEEHFGYTKKCLMETTYRFGEPAIMYSSRFILANPEQAIKIVHPFREETETNLDFIATQNRNDIVETIKRLSDQIDSDKEILLLGRYSFDVNIFKNTALSIHEVEDQTYVYYGQRKLRFLTVHQSKGLESDYVILLNCNGGAMGFPADIADSPVLKYVLTEPDAYAFSEERRVFYVGITRAKKQTWVLYDKNNPSSFIKEFIDIKEQDTDSEDSIPESERCPKCFCGRVFVAKRGKAVNGNPYSVLICTNDKYGCNYRETVFVNLNSSKRSSQIRRF